MRWSVQFSDHIGAGSGRDDSVGCTGQLLVFLSWLAVLVTLPFSLLLCFKVVAEYERIVIFRLGRIKKGGSLGPGLHFEIPCVEHAEVNFNSKNQTRVLLFILPLAFPIPVSIITL